MSFSRFIIACHNTREQLVQIIREIEAKYKHPICILADLQGPKLRVGVFGADSVSFCCACCKFVCLLLL